LATGLQQITEEFNLSQTNGFSEKFLPFVANSVQMRILVAVPMRQKSKCRSTSFLISQEADNWRVGMF
jgi:hypothetical protein